MSLARIRTVKPELVEWKLCNTTEGEVSFRCRVTEADAVGPPRTCGRRVVVRTDHPVAVPVTCPAGHSSWIRQGHDEESAE